MSFSLIVRICAFAVTALLAPLRPSASQAHQAQPISSSAINPRSPRAVWVNHATRVYHCAGSRYYGATKRGEFMVEDAALEAGNRPAFGRACKEAAFGEAKPLSLKSAVKGLTVQGPEKGGGRVWVNLASRVYHCPGTRYYGATKRGRYMTETEAIQSGNRPAYGQRCI